MARTGRPSTYAEETVILEANLYLSGLTYRQIAQRLMIPKSTVIDHLSRRLRTLDPDMYKRVMKSANKRTRRHRFKKEEIV